MSGLLLLVMIERVAVSSKTSSLASGGSPIHSCCVLSHGLGGLLMCRICHFPLVIFHSPFVAMRLSPGLMTNDKYKMTNGKWSAANFTTVVILMTRVFPASL